MRKLLKMITGLLVALTVAFGVQATTVAPASASATGCDSWSAFSISSLPTPVPGGFLCHTITGSGTKVSSDEADFSSYGSFCNWRIDFRYRDVNGVTYRINSGQTQLKCSRYGTRTVYYSSSTTFKPGLACAYLYTNGNYTTKQCHSITY